MAAITVTPANVAKSAGAKTNNDYLAGETIAAGQTVYLRPSDSKWMLAQCDGVAGEEAVYGVATHAAFAGQPLSVQYDGDILIGGTVVVGTIYCVGAAFGSIVPWTDLVTTNKVSVLGYGKSSTTIALKPILTGVAIP